MIYVPSVPELLRSRLVFFLLSLSPHFLDEVQIPKPEGMAESQDGRSLGP